MFLWFKNILIQSPLASEAALEISTFNLRRPVMQRNLRLRAAVTSAARNSLNVRIC